MRDGGAAALGRHQPLDRIDVEDIFGEGDRVAVRNTIRGTHVGEFQGIAPTGRSIEWVVTENTTLFAQITS